MATVDQIPTVTENTAPQNTQAILAATPVMNTSQAGAVLNQYGIDPTQVLTSTNIQNTLTRPTAAPDDLLGIRGQIAYDLGLTAEQNKLNDLKAQYYKAPSVIEGQRLNMSVLRGETGLAQDKLSAQIQAQSDTVNSLASERDYRMGIAEDNINLVKELKLSNPGAKINYGDSMDTIESKLVSYQKEQKKEAQKDFYKDELRKMGLSTSGSRKELEKRLKKANKKAVDRANKAADMQLESTQIQLDELRNKKNNTGSNTGDNIWGGNNQQNNNGSVTTSNDDTLAGW